MKYSNGDEPISITENDIIQFLIDNSSKGHMVSGREIYAAMYKLRYNTDFVGDFSDSTTYNVYRMLDGLVEKSQMGEQRFYYGLAVHSAEIPASEAKDSKDLRRYYVEGPLSDVQIKILRDAIAVYPFAEPKATNDIVYGLNRLTPEYNQELYDPQRISAVKYKGSCYQNIEEISKALSKKKYINHTTRSDKTILAAGREDRSLEKPINTIRFKYCSYNSKKELVLSKPKITIDDDPYIREVNPVKLLWTNGYYYLVTYAQRNNGPQYKNYRVDRMLEVKCTDKRAELPAEPFDEVKYRNKNPVMYADATKRSVTMICKRELINNVIDTFGFDVIISDIDAQRVRVDLSQTSLSGVKMWALEYGFGCEIVSPQSLRKELRKAAEHLLATYSRGTEN